MGRRVKPGAERPARVAGTAVSVGRGAAVVVVEARRRAVARADGEDSFIVVDS